MLICLIQLHGNQWFILTVVWNQRIFKTIEWKPIVFIARAPLLDRSDAISAHFFGVEMGVVCCNLHGKHCLSFAVA